MRTSSMARKSGSGLSRAVWVWSVLFLIFMLFMGIALFQGNRQSAAGEVQIQRTSDMILLTQRMTTFGLEAMRGQPQAFLRLEQLHREFIEKLSLVSGLAVEAGKAGAAPGEFAPDIEKIQQLWSRYNADVETILSVREQVGAATDAIQRVTVLMPDLLGQSGVVVENLRSSLATGSQMYFATNQQVILERIRNSLSNILSGNLDAVTSADQMGVDVKEFSLVLDGMLRGGGSSEAAVKRVNSGKAQDALEIIADRFATVADAAVAIVSASPSLYQVAESTSRLEARGNDLFEGLLRLKAGLEGYYERAALSANLGLIFGLLAFSAFAMLVHSVYSDTRKQLALTRETNQKNQEAILKLLDEMSTLAEGDLTVEATVTEDITGAIADSVNYAVEAMRQLVEAINVSSTQVDATARQTQASATEMAEASQQQAHLISSVSEAIDDLNRSIDKITQNAEDSAEVAESSVTIAHKGAQTVRSSIEGMDQIREKIQETSKRIKRLGESSQEIGDIVGLITDIADQTNILALNAAIQASAAGEGGRGFAVVADEVQRLAERSANASKQIEALVKTIQADTNEAVQSMELTTAKVVHGANLAEDSGRALSEIESVSRRLAALVNDISSEAREQAMLSDKVTDLMASIQRITGQTVASTNDTAAAVGELVEQAAFLQQSVEGFKLSDGLDQIDTGIMDMGSAEKDIDGQGSGVVLTS